MSASVFWQEANSLARKCRVSLKPGSTYMAQLEEWARDHAQRPDEVIGQAFTLLRAARGVEHHWPTLPELEKAFRVAEHDHQLAQSGNAAFAEPVTSTPMQRAAAMEWVRRNPEVAKNDQERVVEQICSPPVTDLDCERYLATKDGDLPIYPWPEGHPLAHTDKGEAA
ncbi:MAG TPA: hypothetical protein VEL28_13090 [Candidatus Binatia bacterium]|nr:hypothetical protein [Candidatus Binatia bacterium]